MTPAMASEPYWAAAPSRSTSILLTAEALLKEKPDPTEDDIIAHCRARIGGYKVPRRMAFVDAMPKSAMGKILKNELRGIYGGD